SLPARSHVDAYMINEVLSYGKKGAFLGNEKETGIPNNIGIISAGVKPLDTDGDGMPDAWEEANGLNKNSAADAVQVATNGYLNIENYINSLNGPVAEYMRCPSELEFVERTTSSVTIKWRNNSTDADQIVVQKSSNGSSFTDAATIAGTETSYTITGLPEDSYCYFRLISKKAGLADSTPSEVFRETTAGPAKAPDQAINPTPAMGGTSRFYTAVDFSWEENTRPWGGDIKYDVYFGNSADNLTKVASGLTKKTFSYPVNMTMNATYYWRVDNTNDVGTTTGEVWNFNASEYSFAASYVDLGKDYNPDTKTQISPSSGVNMTTTDKTYTINSGKVNEFKYTVSGATMESTNGAYSTANVNCVKMTANTNYIEGSLTTISSKQIIPYIKLNGTSDNVGTEITVAVLFSDKVPFDVNSVIGYEEVLLPGARAGVEAIQVLSPNVEITKSFRVYRSVTVSTIDEDLYQIGNGGANVTTLGNCPKNPRIAYLAASLELLSFDGEGGEKDTDNTISAATINGKTATIVKSTGAIDANFRYGTPYGAWPVTFTLTSQKATADFTSGNTHDFSQGPLTITVTAQNGDTKAYTVNANVMQKPTIGLLTANGKAESYDDLFLSAFSDYDVVFLTAAATAPADIAAFYDAYNLIVVHANVTGANATLGETRKLVGVLPILNMKAFCYTSGRWSWGTPAKTVVGAITSQVETKLQNHNIFAGLTFEGQNLTFHKEATTDANGIQYATLGGTNWTAVSDASHTLATYNGSGNVHIHEVNLNNAAKYIMIGLSQEGDSYAKFNTNTVTMLKNAAAYLMDPLAYYDYNKNQPGVGIDNPDAPAVSNLRYYDGAIHNPEGEAVKVYSLSGTTPIASSEATINVAGLPKGIYMAVSPSGSLKFIK
ncbi:fibronectin type III domain-containing protein, partial [Bacteroidales bacterium OttesenSCG-928-L03]|nr:fibronectin type III domain-containing protein [Bacteroidales bacterium OttesenSCG-928-L03]